MPTIREVAESAGVSSTTVSHVINNTRFVSAGTRQRVDRAMKELGYRPNSLARSLRRGETNTLGLVLPDSANPFFAEMARAVESAAFSLGYSVMICNTEDDLVKEAHYVEVLTNKQVDGIIFIAAGDRSNALHRMHQGFPPVILVDRDLGEVQLDTVQADNRLGGYLAARHLIETGCRRLACITGSSNVTPSALRITGFTQAIEEAGLSCPADWICRGDFHPSTGYRAAQYLFSLPNPPDGIFACNDLMAIGALRAALESGRSVPADVAIVGFDDIELASYTIPPLTTIAQPKTEMAQLAVKLLVERISDGAQAARSLLLPPILIQRQSTRRFQ